MKYTIYCDNLIEAHWFMGLSSLLAQATIIKILGRGQNPKIIDSLIEYDRPDIILLADANPVLVLEKTREVPTGHNVGQRIARLVRAVELGIPTIKFFPFDAMKHGEYAGACNLNIRLLEAFEKMAQIHKTPILAINWPVDSHYELLDSGIENKRVSAVVHDYLKSGFDKNCGEIASQIKMMENEYNARLTRRKSYSAPPNSVQFLDTIKFIQNLPYPVEDSTKRTLLQRGRSVVYIMDMTPSKCRREDPYTGTQFIYDYLWCRNGPKVEHKASNLILQFPGITKSTWYKKNPNDKSRKSCNWYLTANALAFSNGIDLLRA